MTYKPRNFMSLLGMKGFSNELLKDHFGLYEGYVSQTNELIEKRRELMRTDPDSATFAELTRRLGWEFNGMRLHELYFSNLGGNGTSPSRDVTAALKEAFGSVDAWRREFEAVAAMRGVGWAILYLDPASSRFMNLWIDEHATYHPTGCAPLLAMDVWEHAFAKDYGTDRGSYIEAFMENINWNAVDSRLTEAAATVLATR